MKEIDNNPLVEFNYNATLFIVPTPIGNLQDITLRSLDVLKSVDVILCEDTRYTIRLLNHYKIKKKLISYHGHSDEHKDKQVLELLCDGKNIALVSNAGMPLIADPGYPLIKKVIDQKLNMIVLPGPSAVITAAVASGMKLDAFVFGGWMPRKTSGRIKLVEKYVSLGIPLIVLESPHRIVKTLQDISIHFSEITISLSREMSKVYEEHVRGSALDVLSYLEKKKIRGEITIVLNLEKIEKSSISHNKNFTQVAI